MNHANRSIPLEQVTSMDVNKAIQRSVTKAIGRHGLGLSVYAGEDLVDTEPEPIQPPKKQAKTTVERSPKAQKLFEEADQLISEAIKGKSREEMKPIVDVVKEICGGANYKAVTDEKILKNLLDHFKK